MIHKDNDVITGWRIGGAVETISNPKQHIWYYDPAQNIGGDAENWCSIEYIRVWIVCVGVCGKITLWKEGVPRRLI